MTEGVLVVGYGNALRSDDGVGRRAAERLAVDPRFDGVTVLGRHQLTPELALDISRAVLVVFVDASHVPPAGAFTIERLAETAEGGDGWSHWLSPATLVGLARELYGHRPDVFLVGVGVDSLMPGDELSPVVEEAMPRLVDAIAELVADRGAASRAMSGAESGRA